MTNTQRWGAEAFGTFWLVLGGCGTARDRRAGGVGTLGISFAFGLTVLTMAYAVGHISGGHFNPAVTIGLWIGKRFELRDVAPYVVAQLVGGGARRRRSSCSSPTASTASRPTRACREPSPATATATSHRPATRCSPASCARWCMTAFFLLIIMGSTHGRAPVGFAPVAIGLSLTLIHLISIPVTNTSVNPARSFGVAVFAGSDALEQLWLFIVAPIAGAVIGAFIYARLLLPDLAEPDIEGGATPTTA